MQKMDYAKLRGLIKEKELRQSDLSKVMRLSESALSQKLNCKYPFTTTEIRAAVDFLGISADQIGIYFFTPKV